MAFSRPLGQMVLRGRSQLAIEEDGKRFEKLATFIAAPALERYVAKYLQDNLTAELRQALGNLVAQNGEFPDDLVASMQREVDAGAQLSQQELASAVKDEAAHARREIVRTWVNLLSFARGQLVLPKIPLDDALLPAEGNFVGESLKEWRIARDEDEAALQKNVALTPNALGQVRAEYVRVVCDQPRPNAPLLLPHGLGLFVENRKFFLGSEAQAS